LLDYLASLEQERETSAGPVEESTDKPWLPTTGYWLLTTDYWLPTTGY
jgi:hypothetical protein